VELEDIVWYLAWVCGACILGYSCPSPQIRQDRNRLRKLRDRAATARNHPGDVQAVLNYSVAVRNAREAGTFQRCPHPETAEKKDENPGCTAHARQHVNRASRLLERAARTHKPAAPSLLAEKGVLLIVVGRHDAGLEELNRSMKIRPNFDAATALVLWHGRNDHSERVTATCERTYPHLETASKRYALLDSCVEYADADSIRAALSWASPEVRQFYLRERQRRTRAEREKRRRQQARRRRAQQCVAQCRERHDYCANGCHSQRCEYRCKNAYQSCIDGCEAKYR